MRILIVIGGFFPGKKCGGPPVSVDNFCSLMKEYDCYIITVNHDLLETTPYENIHEGWNDRGNSKVLYLSDAEYRKETFEKVINEIKPDLLYLQGVFQSCVLPCLQLAKRYTLPVLLAPRGELCAGALNIKKWKKIPYIKGVNAMGLVKDIHWQSTSDEETEAIKQLMKANDNHIHRLPNIPSIPNRVFMRREKVTGEGRFIFLSRIHPKKNLISAIRYFDAIEGKAWLDIYGPIEDENYWKQCQCEIEKLPENVKVEYKGLVDHDKVHEIFSQYDAFLFPTLSENYGHVISESLIVGTPVIISDQTPWQNLEVEGAGWDIALDDGQKFRSVVKRIISMNDNTYASLRLTAKAFIEKKIKLDVLREAYNSVLVQENNN